MDPISIHFVPPLTASQTEQLLAKGKEMAVFLQSQLIAELEGEVKANPDQNDSFIARRAAAGHLHWEMVKAGNELLSLVAAPTPRFHAAFDHSEDLARLWLKENIESWCRDQLGYEAKELAITIQEWPEPIVQPTASSEGRNSKTGNWVRGIVGVAFVLVMGLVGFTLFKMYRLVDDVHDSYSQIETTIDRKTDEIIDKVEKGITTSDRVVNMVDKVRDLVVPEDSASQ